MQYFHMTLGINESWAGSTFCWDGTTTTGTGAKENCLSSASRIAHLDDNGTPDIIIIYGGTNDIGIGAPIGSFNTENPANYTDEQIAALNVETFADAVRATLIRVLKSYPTAKVFLVLPNFTTTYYTPAEADQYNEVLKEACDYFGIPYIDTRTCGITLFNILTYMPDGTHYNDLGMSLLYETLKQYMNTH